MPASCGPAPIRHAMVPVAAAVAAGIIGDRLAPQPLSVWILCGFILAAGWGFVARVFGPSRLAAAFLLVWIACLGAARHHLIWSVALPDDLSLFAGKEPRLVKLRATLADQPEIISPSGQAARSAWMRHETSAVTLRCHDLISGSTLVPVSGRAALRVSGQLLHADVGDEVEVYGWLMRPAPARNPGAFDAAEFLRRQGIGCLITADHPDAVHRIRKGSERSLWRWAARLRAEGEVLFNRDLSPRNAPVAAALLFGSRLQMDEEIRDAFTNSGTLHVLAISGTHVAILALLIWGVCRLGGLSVRVASLMTMAGVVGYTLLTDCRPPVIRATLLVCLFGASRLLFRRPALSNGLALAAVAILLWNPTDLFDVGAQLSFLGVLAVMWAGRQIAERNRTRSIVAVLTQTKPTAFGKATHSGWNLLRDGFFISTAAALFTMPLIAARFHMVSPVSVLVNVVLAPFSTLLLWAGYLHGAVGLAAPWASRYFAVLFDGLLTMFVALVEAAAHVRLSHAYVPGPPEWWLVGYYVALLSVAFLRPMCAWGARRWSLLAAWAIVGLVWGLRSPAPKLLRCTFLSVGHGGAILLETPSGRTLLYDAGTMQDGRVAQRAVQSTLWERRYAGLDAILISHADIDHFNGTAGLMESVPVGRLLLSQQFLDFRQPAVKVLCDASAECGVPIKLVREGDRLRLGDDVAMSVLHPQFGHPHSDDNANSIVLLIEYAGRRILLTGDLDGSGQRALLEQPPRHVDVLLAPHHGSRKANPAALARWATPSCVVVSADRRVDFKSLRAAYGPDADILSTYEVGAVTFEITREGRVGRSTFLRTSAQHDAVNLKGRMGTAPTLP
jgi:competence protein ComEC